MIIRKKRYLKAIFNPISDTKSFRMLKDMELNTRIEGVKNQLYNDFLLIVTALGTVAYIASFFFRLKSLGFQFSFVYEIIILFLTIMVTLFRKRLHIKIKTILLIILFFFYFIYDTYRFGQFSNAKYYLILIPIFAISVFSLQSMLILSASTVFIFLGLGLLHYFQIIQIQDDLSEYAAGLTSWITNACHICAVATIIALFSYRLISVYRKSIVDLEETNLQLENTQKEIAENRDHLENIVKRRTEDLESANQKLKVINEQLIGQTEKLEMTVHDLNKYQKQIVESEKMAMLGVLSAGIAHEINNPLNFIHGGVLSVQKYIIRNLNQHAGKLEPFFTGIHEGVKRCSEIVKSLSHYSRNIHSQNTVCNVHAIIDDCLVMLNNQMKNRTEVIRHYARMPLVVTGEEGKLHQAFLNILSNADQAIERNGSIIITSELIDHTVRVTIADNGKGIDKDDLVRIFDPFFTTKKAGEGTGLGLSITYHIIKEHKGNIEFESEIGKGTKVTITLPADINDR